MWEKEVKLRDYGLSFISNFLNITIADRGELAWYGAQDISGFIFYLYFSMFQHKFYHAFACNLYNKVEKIFTEQG